MSLADVSALAQTNRLGALVDDVGGFVAENISATAHDCMLEIPVGIQLVGAMHQESSLLQLGQQLESSSSWHNRKPILYAT